MFKLLPRSIREFLAVYLTKSSSETGENARITKLSTYAAHTLLAVGAITSIPALISAFWSLWFGLLDFWDGVPAMILTGISSSAVLVLVDMNIAGAAPYLFDKTALSLSGSSNARQYIVLGVLTIIVVGLSYLSMSFSSTGNKAVVAILFPNTHTYEQELATLDSTHRAHIKEIENRYNPAIEKQVKADKEAFTTLSAQGAKLIKNRIEAEKSKYANWMQYRGQVEKISKQAKKDSAALVDGYTTDLPQQKIALTQKLAECERVDMERKEAIKLKHQEQAQNIEKKSNAVYFLTGVLGTAATPLGLLFLAFVTLVNFKTVLKMQPSGLPRSAKDIKDDIHRYISEYRKKQIINPDPQNLQNTADRLSQFIDELYNIGADADAAKMYKKITDEFGSII